MCRSVINTKRIFGGLLSILSVAAVFCTYGQERRSAYLVDEFANVFCSDELRSRLDAFFVEIARKPDAVGYVISSPDERIPGRHDKYREISRKHVEFRGMDPKRVVFETVSPGKSTHFQFWMVPDGVEPPPLNRNPTASITTGTLFDSSNILTAKSGQVQFGSLSEEPCDFGLNFGQYARAIVEDSNLRAYLVASSLKTASDTRKVKRALKLTAEKLIRSHGISRERIRTVYAGRLGESTMQLWLVPSGGPAPKFRPDTIP